MRSNCSGTSCIFFYKSNKYYLSGPRDVGYGISIGFAIEFDRRVLLGIDVAARRYGFYSRRHCKYRHAQQ